MRKSTKMYSVTYATQAYIHILCLMRQFTFFNVILLVWIISSCAFLVVQVYCEMGLNAGGYTFIHPFHLPLLTQAELNAMFMDYKSFLLRMRLSNGEQKFGVLEQLSQYR